MTVYCCSFINSTTGSWAGKEISLLNQNRTIVIWNRGFAETWHWETREESEDDNASLSHRFRQHWVSRGSRNCSGGGQRHRVWPTSADAHSHRTHVSASASADYCSQPRGTELGHQFPEMCLEMWTFNRTCPSVHFSISNGAPRTLPADPLLILWYLALRHSVVY